MLSLRSKSVRIFSNPRFSFGSVKSHRQAHFVPFSSPVENHSAVYDARYIAMAKQRTAYRERKRRRIEDTKASNWAGDNDDILGLEAAELLTQYRAGNGTVSTLVPNFGADDGTKHPSKLFVEGEEVQLDVVELSSTGDGLAVSKDGDHVYVIPYTIPGDTVTAKLNRNRAGQYSMTNLVEIVKPSPDRADGLIKCKYFAKCAGCQLQMLPYELQLRHKKKILERAFRSFSGLSENQIPLVQDTMGSPLQYGYRTKITPWFTGPVAKGEIPPIGFSMKGRRSPIDIESCPISTEIVQEGLQVERARVGREISTYKRGATLLLRESTKREFNLESSSEEPPSIAAEISEGSPPLARKELTHTSAGKPLLKLHYPGYTEYKTCQTDMTGNSTEYVDNFVFTNRAGSFFQNNNSILSPFTAYVRDHLFPHDSDHPTSSSSPRVKYLLDAYCGSGLFSITLASLFTSVLGIDIDPAGITAARHNASNNNIPNAGFIEADASALFADVPFPPDQTLCVIDPPRKGCSADFLRQLLQFGPKRVVYVSCNVHTQARDVGVLVNGFEGALGFGSMEGAAKKLKQQDGGNLGGSKIGEVDAVDRIGAKSRWRYELESLKGFDFFPQTGHVEGLALLNRIDRSRE